MRRREETKKEEVFGLVNDWVKIILHLDADRFAAADNYNPCASEGSASSNAPQVLGSGFMQQAVIQHKMYGKQGGKQITTLM